MLLTSLTLLLNMVILYMYMHTYSNEDSLVECIVHKLATDSHLYSRKLPCQT